MNNCCQHCHDCQDYSTLIPVQQTAMFLSRTKVRKRWQPRQTQHHQRLSCVACAGTLMPHPPHQPAIQTNSSVISEFASQIRSHPGVIDWSRLAADRLNISVKCLADYLERMKKIASAAGPLILGEGPRGHQRLLARESYWDKRNESSTRISEPRRSVQ